LGLSEPGRLDRIREILEKLHVPVKLRRDLAEKDVIDLVKRDKKAINKWPRFVLVAKMGKVHRQDEQYAVEVAPEIVEKVLKELY
jgi:3-dehydroquinate synthetase